MKIKFSTRIVILTKTKAYKIPIDRRGLIQCRNEYSVWKSMIPVRPFLAPLVWYRFGIVCQERVQPIKEFDRRLVYLLKDKIPKLNIENCDLHNQDNWGLYNNEQVLLDYGIDQKVSEMY